jgi:predicted ATPase/DNA-binding CsgD family transcriptional regulator
VGRRQLLADVRQRLASSRVVTLVGPGGVGKTRVALRVTELERRTFRQGCWVAPLAELDKPELLSPAVAEALGLHAGDRPWQAETLADHIAERTALLVLDNCEHLVPAVGALVESLRPSCPNLRFLLTSRRPLRLSGEDVVVVPPLAVPDESSAATPDAITHHEAVSLFLDRAASARSDFRLTPANAPAVVALCRDLDGMPLAIELAAARVRALSPQEIRDKLDERLKVLNRGFRDADERHHSLRACVEWSYELCSPLAQTFWTRSSVFTGGYDLAAAAAVCAGDDLPAGEVLDLVTELVDQSVLLAEEAADGSTRYRMLGDVRQLGLERAEKDGELHGMRERHATWCADLVSRFDAEACGPRQRDWLRALRLEHANLRTALEYCAATSEAAVAGLTMARELDLYWSACGWLDEARHWLEVGLASGAGTPSQRATVLAVAARFAVLQNDRVRATQLLDEGTELATAVEDTRARGMLLLPAAMLAVWAGSPTAGAAQADSAVALLRAAADLSGELRALVVAGVCHGFAGNGVEAEDRHRQCIARADEVGERHMKALAVAGLGEHELDAGHLDEATALFRESVVLEGELDNRIGVAVGLDSLGRVAVAEGRGERSALLLGAAEGIWDSVGMSVTGNPFAFAPSRSDGLRKARKLLGTQRFRGLFRQGSLLDLDQAVRLALEAGTADAPPLPVLAEPSPLTRRELEVADLVADGLSNPEIAARLFISVRTAQGHVENILRKLGFTSRSRVAAWVTERRLADSVSAVRPAAVGPGTIDP